VRGLQCRQAATGAHQQARQCVVAVLINDTDGDDNGGEELESENCDLNFGNSDGPIFAWWNNGTDPRLVGVVSAQETEYKFPFSTRNDNFASGDGFVSLVPGVARIGLQR
jgi:hypothetical protein